MNLNEQHRQRMQQQLTAAQQKQQLAQAEAEFKVAVEYYHKLLGKTILVGVQGMGISTTNVTAVSKGEMLGALAVCISTDESAGEDGQWYDVRQLTVYEVYNDEGAGKIKEAFRKRQGIHETVASSPALNIMPPQH